MNEQQKMERLQENINYRFKNTALLYEALSHSSFANENKKSRNSNERLEFLGDSVLSVVVSDYIFKHFKRKLTILDQGFTVIKLLKFIKCRYSE